MRHCKWILLFPLVALAACAQQPVRHASAQTSPTTINYAKYAEGTVPWFHFGSLYSWDSNSPGHVVVWTGPRKAYRLTLAGPCLGLQTTVGAIGLTSHHHLVSSNQDAVLAGRDRCRILRIERLDAKAIRASRSNAKSAHGQHH